MDNVEALYALDDEGPLIDLDLPVLLPDAQYQDVGTQEPRLLPEVPSRDNDPAADFGESVNDIVAPEVPV
eukprot:11669029-Prorocentrum_lima.AAC.1